VTGSPDVFANNLNSLRKNFRDMGVHCCCCGPNIWGTMEGSSDVFINGDGSVRLGDTNWCCGGVGTIITSSQDVFVN
jgi:uncharacterized Zn-binding protein involved in type VI secretion